MEGVRGSPSQSASKVVGWEMSVRSLDMHAKSILVIELIKAMGWYAPGFM